MTRTGKGQWKGNEAASKGKWQQRMTKREARGESSKQTKEKEKEEGKKKERTWVKSTEVAVAVVATNGRKVAAAGLPQRAAMIRDDEVEITTRACSTHHAPKRSLARL